MNVFSRAAPVLNRTSALDPLPGIGIGPRGFFLTPSGLSLMMPSFGLLHTALTMNKIACLLRA
jgi:hypothetical protein